jgi:CDP-diacylglycerol--glycerol-3-phosphate 3-phosphatidyltransferase
MADTLSPVKNSARVSIRYIAQGDASPWAIYLILTRELFITGLRVSAISQGMNISASWMGKVKTVVQMIAIGFLLMHWVGGTLILWVAVALTLYSGYEYVRDFFIHNQTD